MITATVYGRTGRPERVHFAINRGEWYGKTWLVQVGMGYTSCNVLVEADSEQDAIDELADSKRSYLIDTDELCDACAEAAKLETSSDTFEEDREKLWAACTCSFAGNDSHRVNLDNVSINPCKASYFVKQA